MMYPPCQEKRPSCCYVAYLEKKFTEVYGLS